MQEYLVSLGFNVNQNQYAKFKDILKNTASETAKLGVEVVSVGVALTAMVDQVAKQFESLYYMSQRTGATVKNLDAVSYAAGQVGVSASEAQGAVESFASAMRRQPGLKSLFQGVTGRAATGDAEVDIRNFVRSQRGVADFIALQRADALGIPEHTYLQYKNNLVQLEEAEADHIKRMKEAGLDAAIEDRRWVDFSNTIKHLGDQFGIAGTRIAEDWRPQVTQVVEGLDKLLGAFSRADAASEGWIGHFTGLAVAIGGVEASLALLARWFPSLSKFSSILAPVAGAYEAWRSITTGERKNDTGRPPDQDAIDQLPWYQRAAIGVQQSLFGADPNQFLAGGAHGPAGAGSGVPLPRSRPHVGDGANYPLGSAMRMFDDAAASTDNSRTSTFNVNQTNSYVAGSYADAVKMGEFTSQSNTGLATALRNLAAKLQ